MKLSEYLHLSYALSVLGVDIGAILIETAVIPEKWEKRFAAAELELAKLTPEEVRRFFGEETEQQVVALKAPIANEIFFDAFDGDLSDVLFASLTSAFDYPVVEERSSVLLAQVKQLQKP